MLICYKFIDHEELGWNLVNEVNTWWLITGRSWRLLWGGEVTMEYGWWLAGSLLSAICKLLALACSRWSTRKKARAWFAVGTSRWRRDQQCRGRHGLVLLLPTDAPGSPPEAHSPGGRRLPTLNSCFFFASLCYGLTTPPPCTAAGRSDGGVRVPPPA